MLSWLAGSKRQAASAKCEAKPAAAKELPFNISGASADLAKGVPLSPAHDAAKDFKAHQWGFEKIPDGQLKGAVVLDEGLDTLNHQVAKSVFPSDARGFHPEKPSEDRINVSYENMLGDEMSLLPKKAAGFESAWQKKLAYSHGLYNPREFAPAATADDIRIKVSEFEDKVKADGALGSKDACRHLVVEEMRCLQVYQFEKDPLTAGKRCVKWHHEHAKCMWDQHKFNNGYTYLETTVHDKKRRPYLFYPDFKYA